MIIEVKEEDWRNYLQVRNTQISQGGVNFHTECCPITWALKRAFSVEFARVTYDQISVGRFPDDIIFHVPTTAEVRAWLKEYDKDPERNFKEFQFELELPSDTPIT